MDRIAAAEATAATLTPSARRLRILVAEDHLFNHLLAERLLRREGHDSGSPATAARPWPHWSRTAST
jgi:hypothetical protein